MHMALQRQRRGSDSVFFQWIVEGPSGQLLEDLEVDDLSGQFTGEGILVPGDYRARFAIWGRQDSPVAMHVVFFAGTPSERNSNP